MAKKSAKQTKKQIMALLQRPETILGVVVIAATVGLGAAALQKPTKSTVASNDITPQNEVAATTSPVVTPAAVSTESAQPATESAQIASIERLADTSSTKTIVARENDTFWHIARRECGQGKLAYQIERENGYQYRHLQPGDLIEVSCN